MERAHQVRRDATTALQIGLQRIEQRVVQNREPTTFARNAQRRRTIAHVGQITNRLKIWVHDQAHVIASLGQLAVAIRQTAFGTDVELRPNLQSIVERIRARFNNPSPAEADQDIELSGPSPRHFSRRWFPSYKM